MELHKDFIEEIKRLMPDECNAIIEAITATASPVSVRVNSHKCGNVPANATRVKWCERGFYLDERPQFTFDPMFHAGAYYVQDASSMILQYIAKSLISEPVRYLDLCAAPGGKTTAVIDVLPEGSLMVSNEIIGTRAQILKENVVKWGNPNCIVTNNDSRAVGSLTHFFDVVAADVPCSGEGMFRKDDEAVAQWTPALVRQCADRQREIIDNIWQALRPGGLFIYSTCTYNRQEDEDMVEYIIREYEAESVNLNIPAEWGIHSGIGTSAHCYRFLPHLTRGEGLFVAVLRKSDNEQRSQIRKKVKPAKPANIPNNVKQLISGNDMEFTLSDNTITAIPKLHAENLALIQSKLNVILAGIEVATVKGRDFIPSQSLLLSTAMKRDSFPEYETDYATAMAYLRGETVCIDAPSGIVALTYSGTPIGFVKNLGNRANNLYPKEWRIKSTHIPSKAPKIL